MKKLNILFVLVFLITGSYSSYGQTITSAGSGNWSDGATWDGGNVPTSSDDVIISAGHTVTVDVNNAECKNVSFGDATGKLAMGSSASRLNVYGDYQIATTTHVSFSAWPAGAKIRFVGDATQTLKGWTTSTTEAVGSLVEVEIDKTGGKVTTSGTDMKLTIGTSFNIINGTFELASTDDFVGRTRTGTYTDEPTITVSSGGSFIMGGSTSYIRSGGTLQKQIGKMTIRGTVALASSDSRFLNFGGIDIESGGILNINDITGAYFNPGEIKVKSGGYLTINTTNNFWKTDATIPPSLTLNSGSNVNITTTSGVFLPTTVTDNGATWKYSLSGAQTGLLERTYTNLELSGSGTKTLGGPITVNGTLYIIDTATVALGTHTLAYGETSKLQYGISGQSIAQTTSDAEWPATNGPVNVQLYNGSGVTLHDNRTLTGTLTLTLGSFDNNGIGNDKNITLGDDATISRARGSLTAVPIFGSSVNLRYTSSLENVTTGYEMPISTTVLNDLNVSSSQGMTLGADVTVNGTLAVNGSSLTTGDFTIILSPTATLSELAGKTVVGNIQTTRDVVQSVNNTFGGIGIEINAAGTAPGSTIVLRKTGTATTGNGNQGIKRYFQITPTATNGFNATLVFKYDENELNLIPEANLRLFKSTDEGTTWTLEGGTVDPDANTVTLTGIDGFSRWTLASENAPLPVELTSFTANVKGNGVELRWRTESEVNSYLFEVQKSVQNSEWEKAGEVAASGNSNSPREYTFTDDNIMPGKYQYRLRIVDNDGSAKYSNIAEVNTGMPVRFNLSQNYPNPFNPSTTINYQIPEKSFVKLSVFDILGNEVKNLMNEEKEAGYYSLSFNAAGKNFSTGTYFYRMTITGLETGKVSSEVKKMQLIK